MSTFLTVLAILAGLALAYALFLRPWLRDKAWAQGFFKFIEPMEIVLWSKSETILFARLKVVTGIVFAVLTFLTALDISPALSLLPDEWQGKVRLWWGLIPLLLSVIGFIDEKLRKDTTKPLEVVALPSSAPPEVKAAVANAETATAHAVVAAESVKQ